VENEQKTSADLIEQVKTKYKNKSGEYKRKIQELIEANESLAHENNSNKQNLIESKAKHEKIISQMQNDMKMIKSEWEKKCQEIDLNSQRVLVEHI
jgi:regulator of replication initiation timing